MEVDGENTHTQKIISPCRKMKAKKVEWWELKRHSSTLCHMVLALLLGPVSYFVVVHKWEVDFWAQLAVCASVAMLCALALGLWTGARCMLGLSLPQVFTGKGRSVLLAYVLIMAHNGPVLNAVHNSNVLFNVTACWQHQLGQISRQDPQNSEGEMEGGKVTLRNALENFRDSFIRTTALYNETWGEIERQHQWLRQKQTVCTHLQAKLQDAAFNIIYDLYNSQVVSILAWWLPPSLYEMAKNMIQEGFKTVCTLSREDAEGLVPLKNLIIPRLEAIKRYVDQEGGLEVSMDRKWSYTVNWSSSVEEVRTAMWKDVESNFGWIPKFFQAVNFLLGAMSLLVFINAAIYLRKFTRHPYYDNHYHGAGLREFCEKQMSAGGATVLPLQRWEKRHLVAPSSLRMVPRERRKLVLSMILVIISALTVACYVALDYSLFMLLDTLSQYGPIVQELEAPTMPDIRVGGNGIIGHMFVSFVEAFRPFVMQSAPQINITSCMQFEARQPDFTNYYMLGAWMVLCALVTLTNAWGLRLRHVVAEFYYPRVAEKRAAWLYEEILSRRKYSNNILFRRIRRLRGDKARMFGNLFDRIWKKMAKGEIVSCLGCGQSSRQETLFVRCIRKNCRGVLCLQCDAVLRQSCPLCTRNSEVEGDVSEEVDSSDIEGA